MSDVGPDPLKWVERLRDVNASSQFSPEQREIIEKYLYVLSRALKGHLRESALTSPQEQGQS